MNNRSDNELAVLCASKNLSLDALQETINFLGPHGLSSQNPSCFHKACRNEKVTLKIIQLLYSIRPEALRLKYFGQLPIHTLCCNKDLDDTASLDILRFLLHNYPTLLREVGDAGSLPIHVAVKYKSTSFCRELIDAHPESLRIELNDGLPIHVACRYGNRDDTVDTIQYMLELDSELINAEDSGRYLPIHCAAMGGKTKSIELLLMFDPDAASKEINNGMQWLPLHLACYYNTNISSFQVLYDAYPEAIFARDAILVRNNGRTPLDIIARNHPAIDFLRTQLVYAQQAKDMTAVTTVDDDGWLPLHRALKDDAPLGSIKLLVRGNPATLQVADQKGAYPLHIACEFSSVKVVKYLVELAGDTLNNVDANKDSPLHYACRGGNLCVIKHMLEANASSVSERNNGNKLAIHLFFECGENVLDRESMSYVETIYQLLLANPEVVRDYMLIDFFAQSVVT